VLGRHERDFRQLSRKARTKRNVRRPQRLAFIFKVLSGSDFFSVGLFYCREIFSPNSIQMSWKIKTLTSGREEPPSEWKYLLETVAQELYDLSHQLQDGDPIGLADSRSPSLLHLSEPIKTLTPAGVSAGEDGTWNENDSQHAA
jgi:hypothetical protein